MNIRKVIAAFYTFALFASAVAEDLNKVAEQHERDFVRAMKSKDLKWFESVAAPDYHEVGAKGKMTTRAEAIAGMKQMFGMGNVTSATSKVLKVSGSSSKMIVLTSANMTMMMKMDPKAKKMSKMVGTARYQETWSKDKGKWQIHELKSLSEKATLDGKPFNMG